VRLFEKINPNNNSLKIDTRAAKGVEWLVGTISVSAIAIDERLMDHSMSLAERELPTRKRSYNGEAT